MPNCGCNDYSRTQLLRRAAAEAGPGLPAIEPGMPMPAGTGLTQALVRLARHRARAVGLRSGEPRAQGVRGRASRPLLRRRPPSACSSPSSCPEGPTRSRCSPPRARILSTRRTGPRWRCRTARASRSTEDSSLRWHPVVRRARGALRRGQGHGDAGDRLRRREPVALHEPPLLGGRRDQPVRPLGLARALPRPARRGRQPAPGSRARLGPPAGAGRARRAGGDRGGARQLRLLDARRVGLGAGQDARRVRRPGRAVDQRRGPRPGARGGGRHRAPARPARAVPGRLHEPARGDLPGRRLRRPAAGARRRCSTVACR